MIKWLRKSAPEACGPLDLEAQVDHNRLVIEAMPPTLNHPDRQREFAARGYTIVDLIPADVVAELRALCLRHHPAPTSTWECDFYSPDDACKRDVSDGIRAAFQAGIAEHLTGHTTFLHNFVINWPGDDGGLGLHSHSATVDERHSRSAVIWCAITEATVENGTLNLAPRSHHLQLGPKAEGGPAWFDDHTSQVLRDHLDAVELEPGQAIVFDNAVTHCSFANTTDQPRISAVATVARGVDALRYHDWIGEGRVRSYDLDPAFFLTNRPGDMEWAEPDGLDPIEDLDVVEPSYTSEQLHRLLPTGTNVRAASSLH